MNLIHYYMCAYCCDGKPHTYCMQESADVRSDEEPVRAMKKGPNFYFDFHDHNNNTALGASSDRS